jgi:hypothetical protein
VVDNPRQYSTAEVERMMKLQDVMWKAMAKKITCQESSTLCPLVLPVLRARGTKTHQLWKRQRTPSVKGRMEPSATASALLACADPFPKFPARPYAIACGNVRGESWQEVAILGDQRAHPVLGHSGK